MEVRDDEWAERDADMLSLLTELAALEQLAAERHRARLLANTAAIEAGVCAVIDNPGPQRGVRRRAELQLERVRRERARLTGQDQLAPSEAEGP